MSHGVYTAETLQFFPKVSSVAQFSVGLSSNGFSGFNIDMKYETTVKMVSQSKQRVVILFQEI